MFRSFNFLEVEQRTRPFIKISSYLFKSIVVLPHVSKCKYLFSIKANTLNTTSYYCTFFLSTVILLIQYQTCRGRRGSDRIVVGFNTNCAVSAYFQ